MNRALTALGARLRNLHTDRSGAVAMIFGLGLLGLVLMTGFGIDYYRWSVAESETQAVVDGAALSAAASHKKTQNELRDVVAVHVEANQANMRRAFVNASTTTRVEYDEDQRLHVNIRGTVDTLFMGMIGVNTMPLNVTGVAQRGEAEAVELALVLDNTWSMSDTAGGGTTKIAALRAAAENLVNTLKENEDADVKIAVVPYADYVNVGLANKTKPWVQLDSAERDVVSPRVCSPTTTTTTCTGGTYTSKTCTSNTDGILSNYECGSWSGRTCTTKTENKESCSGGGTTRYRWYGCVGSRRTGNLRLNDTLPATPYPGYVETSQRCLNPIVPLTSSKSTVVSAVRGLIINIGSYKPLTYIPGGLIWGINVLSPSEPFSEGRAYSVNNKEPRKIMVLMTDGENTLQFRASDGRHIAFSGAAAAQTVQYNQVNAETAQLCGYAKSKGIEMYTVALAVNSTAARTMLQNCASDSDHYFNASDTAALGQAFTDIAASINRVRLVE